MLKAYKEDGKLKVYGIYINYKNIRKNKIENLIKRIHPMTFITH